MPHVLAFDPGGTTGWALGAYSDTDALEFWDGGQIPDGVPGFCRWVMQHSMVTFGDNPLITTVLSYRDLYSLQIVSESFQLRPGVKSPDLTPVKIEGAMTALLGEGTVVYQQPALKSLVSDHKLQDNGLWIPGERHHMDARIHAMAYMLRQTHMPTINKYWPDGN